MEYCCKFYINKDVKSWRVPRAFKHLKKQRKEELIRKFDQRLGLDLYKVMPGGVGNSNRGNTSRDAFDQSDVFAEILEVNDPLLIEDLGVMLNAANCTLPVGRTLSFPLFLARKFKYAILGLHNVSKNI